jgi:hypothetical protein
MKVISIDVGNGKNKTDGICLFNNKDIIWAMPLPRELKGLNELISKEENVDLVVIEKQQARSLQGCKSVFGLGQSYGYIIGTIEANNLRYELVHPRTWQSSILKNQEINTQLGINDDSKAKSLSLVIDRYPNIPIKTKRGKLLHGVADAICLGLWALSNIDY